MPKTSNTKNTYPFGQEIAWKPNKKWIAESNLSAFIKDHNLKDYDDLMERSTSDYAWFWENVLKDLDIQFYKPYDKIVDLERGIQFPRWCVGGKMNIIHNCLDKWQSGPIASHEALRWEGEEGTVKVLTYGELDKEVCRCANALRSLGLGKGDVIALYMPMIPELAIAFLSIIKIGGIILPLFSGYGPGAITTRLADSKAKAVFTVDGAPDFPTIERLWQQIDGHRITHLGVSPTLIRTLKNHGTEQLSRYNLKSLRMVGSTGSPWDPESWIWLFENVLEGKKPILNYSGGTEISGGILCGNFFKPLKPCAFSGPVPGMDADVVDESGQPVKNQVGELIIRKPWIGMTRGFWKDEKRYLETYWDRYKDIWVHGDFAAIDKDNLWYILGRSDAPGNPGCLSWE